MKDITKLLKKSIKENINATEEMLQTEGATLEKKAKALLDINNDGQLTKSDIISLLVDFVDTDEDGKISIWEFIAVLFQLRKILKRIKK